MTDIGNGVLNAQKVFHELVFGNLRLVIDFECQWKSTFQVDIRMVEIKVGSYQGISTQQG